MAYQNENVPAADPPANGQEEEKKVEWVPVTEAGTAG